MRKIIFLIVALLLSGCAHHSDLLAKDKPLLADTAGLVVASFGTGLSIDVHFRSVEDPNGEEYLLTTNGNYLKGGAWRDKEVVRSTANGARLLVGCSVKPGRYQVTRARLSANTGSFEYFANLKPLPSEEFEVLANGIAYLGSYQAHIEVGKTMVGLSVPRTVRFFTQDEIWADHDLLLKVRPELKAAQIHNFASVR